MLTTVKNAGMRMLNESGACVAWDQYDPHIFTYVIVAWNPAKFSLSAFICSGLSFLKQRLFCPGTAATTASLRVHMLVSCGGRLLQIYNPKITSSSTYMSDNMFSDVHPWKYILFNMILNNFIYITYLYEGILNFIRVWHFFMHNDFLIITYRLYHYDPHNHSNGQTV